MHSSSQLNTHNSITPLLNTSNIHTLPKKEMICTSYMEYGYNVKYANLKFIPTMFFIHAILLKFMSYSVINSNMLLIATFFPLCSVS